MSEQEIQHDGYITLKEASELSGYSSDYIGQLIRKGKIPGKQVYMNVAWVTTEESVRDYFDQEGRKNKGEIETKQPSETRRETLDRSLDAIGGEMGTKLLSVLLYCLLAIGVVVVVVLLYVVAITIDRSISAENYNQTIEGGMKKLELTPTQASRLIITSDGYARR